MAHLDQDPANSAAENLVFLCLDHHAQFDSRTSQSKGLTPQEVKSYRVELYQAMEDFRAMKGEKLHNTAMVKLEQFISEQRARYADITHKIDSLADEWREFQKNIGEQTQSVIPKERD